jgi:hypothetical protein
MSETIQVGRNIIAQASKYRTETPASAGLEALGVADRGVLSTQAAANETKTVKS